MEFTKDIEFNNSPTAEHELIITYRGFLKDAPALTIVYGFDEAWHYTTETPMTKIDSGFSAHIPIKNFDTFHFCFRDSNQQWDNNGNCNYISSIFPCPEQAVFQFDIDALIEEILQPILIQEPQPDENPEVNQIVYQPIDLGLEIKNILSQIESTPAPEDLTEYSTLDEILSCTLIEQTPIELFENEPVLEEFEKDISPVSEEMSLVNIPDSFMISPRKLSKFYFLKKHLKLSLYKLFSKIPKLIFGSEE